MGDRGKRASSSNNNRKNKTQNNELEDRKKWTTPHRTTNRNKLNLTQNYANKFNGIYSCSAEMNCKGPKNK